MGTRADFYIGRGESAEWIGSVAWDGYPSDFSDTPIFSSRTEQEFRDRVAAMLASRDDATLPKDGWPWPWPDSRTTDYAYAFDGGRVHAACFGHRWRSPKSIERDEYNGPQLCVFPTMDTTGFARAGTQRSGNIVIGGA